MLVLMVCALFCPSRTEACSVVVSFCCPTNTFTYKKKTKQNTKSKQTKQNTQKKWNPQPAMKTQTSSISTFEESIL